MPQSGTGVATLTFPASPQAAQYRSSVVVEDSVPSNVDWVIGQLPAGTSNTWRSTAYGGGIWVACTFSNNAARSTDGITWTSITLPLLHVWVSASYGNGAFVVVSSVGASAVSANGSSWDSYLMPAGGYNGCCFGAGRFVAVPGNSSTTGAYSTDGVTWTASTLPGVAIWSEPVYGDGGFITLQGNTSQKSSDGSSWSSGGTLPSSANWNCAFGNGTYVALNSSAAVYSKDGGTTWEAGLLPGAVSGNINSLVFGNGRFIAVTDIGGFLSSFDGVTWSREFSPPFGAVQPTEIAFGNDMYLVTCNGSNDFAYLKKNTRTLTTINTETLPAAPVPGSNIATVTITGLPDITATSSASAFIDGDDTTADRNAYEHEKADIRLSCDNFVPGVGFTITATSDVRLDGDVKVRYVWRA